jgi:hypothetical protein
MNVLLKKPHRLVNHALASTLVLSWSSTHLNWTMDRVYCYLSFSYSYLIPVDGLWIWEFGCTLEVEGKEK